MLRKPLQLYLLSVQFFMVLLKAQLKAAYDLFELLLPGFDLIKIGNKNLLDEYNADEEGNSQQYFIFVFMEQLF